MLSVHLHMMEVFLATDLMKRVTKLWKEVKYYESKSRKKNEG